jgi:hypothetical protein
MYNLKLLIISTVLIVCGGCSTLLPSKSTSSQAQWKSYQDIETLANHIHAGQTLDDLKTLGIDVKNTPNMESLTHLDIAKRFGLIGRRDESLVIPAGVKKLMDAAEKGKGYELTVESTQHNRLGSFWADFLQFRKNVHTTGWTFSMLLIVVDDKVEYVLYKGNPNIDKLEKEKNPLGPFQKISGYIIVDLLAD